ncbi:hypothetical protein REPUB_Repub10bG0024200 [Reevesia pubescens]
MATEAEIIPEPISLLKTEEESKHLTLELCDKAVEFLQGDLKKLQGGSIQPAETDESLAKAEDKEVAGNNGVETMNTVSEGNPEIYKGESFLISPEIAKVVSKETCGVSEHNEVDDTPFKAEKIPEDEEKVANDKKFQLVEEAATVENEVKEATEDRMEKGDTDHGNEELNPDIGGEKSVEAVEVIADRDSSLEEKHGSIEEETSHSQKNENEGTKTDENADIESNKQEANVELKKRALIDIPDPIIDSMKEANETVTEDSDSNLVQEELEEKSFKEVKDTEQVKLPALEGKEEGTEAIEPIETSECKKDQIISGRIGETLTSTVTESSEIKDHETTSEINENAKRKLHNLYEEVACGHEPAPEAVEKIEEDSDIIIKDKSQATIESSEEIKHITGENDGIQDNNVLDTSSVMKTENTDVESPTEESGQSDINEKTDQDLGTSRESCKDYANSESEKGAVDVVQATDKELVMTEASDEMKRDEESTVPTPEGNISEVENIDVVQQSQEGKSENEEILKESFQQQNEREKEKPACPLNAVYEDMNTVISSENAETGTSTKEVTSVKDHEEGFEGEGMEDAPTNTDAVSEDRESKEKDHLQIEVNETTESVEVEIPNKNADDLHVTDSLVGQSVEKEDEKQYEFSDVQPEEQVREAKQEHSEDVSEECQSRDSTISEHVTEAAATTDLKSETSEIDKENVKEVYLLDSENCSESNEALENKQEEIGKELEDCTAEKPEPKNAMENIEDNLKQETKEVSEGPKSITKEECAIIDDSPKFTEEELHKSFQEDENKETPRVEVSEKQETDNTIEDAEKQILEEEDAKKDQTTLLTETMEEKSVAMMSIKEVCKESETAVSGTGKENLDTEEHPITDISNSAISDETVKESIKGDESGPMKSTEDASDSNIKEITLQTLEETGEPNNDPSLLDIEKESKEEIIEVKEDVVCSSSFELEDSKKDTGEGTSVKGSVNTADLDSASPAEETEETNIKEAEAEAEKEEINNVLAVEEKSLATIEHEGIDLDSADIDVNPADSSITSEKEKIPQEEDQMPDKVPNAGSDDPMEMTTREIPLKEILGDEVKEQSTISTEEYESHIEDKKITNETSEKDQVRYGHSETPVSQATDEILMQEEDNPTLDVPKAESEDTREESGHEVEQHLAEESYVHTKQETKKCISVSEATDVSNGEEPRELEDQSDACEAKTQQDEQSSDLGLEREKIEDGKPLDEATDSGETSDTCKDGENATREENLAKSLEKPESLKEDTEVEKEKIELPRGAHDQIPEVINLNDNAKNVELALAGFEERPKFDSEAVAEDQSKEAFPEPSKNQVDETSVDVQNRESEKETKEEPEDKLKDEEVTKAVILSEEVSKEAEKVDVSEDIKEHVMEEESSTNELHPESKGDETTNEEDYTLISTECLKEQREAKNSAAEEHSTKDREASFVIEESKERRQVDEESGDPVSVQGEDRESEENIEDIVDNTIEDAEKQILEEEDTNKDQTTLLTETMEEKSVAMMSIKEVCKDSETAAPGTEKENPDMEEHPITDISNSAIIDETVKESIEGDESSPMKSTEEASDSNIEETTLQTLEETAEPNNDPSLLDIEKESKEEITAIEVKEDVVCRSSFELEESKKDTGEEISVKGSVSTADLDSTSPAAETEETNIKEAEAEAEEEKEEINNVLVVEENSLATIEHEGIRLDSADIDLKPVDSSITSENEKEIPQEEDGMPDKVPNTGSEDQMETTTREIPLKEILGDEMKEHSTISSEQYESTNIEERNITDVPKVESEDTGEESGHEVKEHLADKSYVHTEQETGKCISVPEATDVSNEEEPRELEDQSDACEAETLQDEQSSDLGLEKEKIEDGKPLDEATDLEETSNTCKDGENAIREDENLAKNLEKPESLKEDTEVEKEETEPPRGAHDQIPEVINLNDNAKNVELALAGFEEKPKFDSEAVAEDQSKETFPEPSKNQVDETSVDVQNRESEKETKEEPVDKLMDEEVTKVVILPEEGSKEAEKADVSEDIKEHVMEEESSTNELHPKSKGDETTNKEEDYTSISTECLKEADSKEQIEAENSAVEEHSTMEREASLVIEESKERRQVDEESRDHVHVQGEDRKSKENIKEDIVDELKLCQDESDEAVKKVRAETSLNDIEVNEKSNVSSGKISLETTETDANQESKEVENVKLGDISSDLAPNDNDKVEKQSRNVDIVDEDEAEVIKIDPDAVYMSKDQIDEAETSLPLEKADQLPNNDHGVVETESEASKISDELGKIELASEQEVGTKQSLTVEELEVNEVEETKGVIETSSDYLSQRAESVMEDDISSHNTLPEEKPEEQLQPSVLTLASEDEKIRTVLPNEKIEEAIQNDVEIGKHESLEDSSDAKTTEDVCLQKEEEREPKAISEEETIVDQGLQKEELEEQVETTSSTLLSEEREHGTRAVSEEIEYGKTKEKVPTKLDVITGDEITGEKTLSVNKPEEGTTSSALLSKEQEEETISMVDKIDEEKKSEAEISEDSSDLKETAEICLENEEFQKLEDGKKDETAAALAIHVEEPKEQSLTPALPSQNIEHGPKANEEEEEKAKEVEMLEKEICLEKERPQEPEAAVDQEITVAQASITEKSLETETITVGKLDEEKWKEEGKLEDENCEGLSARETEEICLQKEEPNELHAIPKEEITSGQTFSEEQSNEQLHTSASAVTSEELEHETMETEDGKTNIEEIVKDEIPEDTSDARTTEELCSQKETSIELEDVVEDEKTASHTLTENKSEEQQFQNPTSELPSKEEECGSISATEKIESEKIEEAEYLQDDNKEAVSLQKERLQEDEALAKDEDASSQTLPMKKSEEQFSNPVVTLPSDEYKHETVNEVEKTEEKMQNEDSDEGKTTQEISSEKDETKEPQAVLEGETIASQVIVEESQEHGTLKEEKKIKEAETQEDDKSLQSERVKELQSALEDGATAAQILSEEKQANQLHITTSTLSSEVQEDETKETELQEDESPEKIPEQTREIEEASKVKTETRGKAFDNEILTESEDAAIKDKLVKARDETKGGENQSEETNEGNEIILSEVSKEQVMEDKEVTETSYSTSHLEVLTTDGSGEDELKDKLIEDKTNEGLETTQNEELIAEAQKSNDNEKIQKQIVCEDKTVEDPGQTSVAKIETATVTEEESSTELSLAEGNEIVDDIQQPEETTNVAFDERIPRELDPIENAEITSSIGKEHVPIDLHDRVAESLHNADIADVKEIDPKQAEVDHSGEEITDNSGEEITKESASVEDSIKVLSSDHVESSTKETLQVTEDIIEEREAKDETADAQILLMEKPEQTPAHSSKLLSEEREHGGSIQVDATEEKELKEPSDEHKHETVNEVDKTEEEMQNEDSDGEKTVQEISSEKDETKEPQAVLEGEAIASQEPSLELSQADSEGTKNHAEGNEIVDDIQQPRETTNVASDEQILRELDPIENAEITSSICKEHVPIDLQDRVADVKDICPKEAEVDHSGEEITDNSDEEITKESTSVEDSIKVLSSDHVESSTKETLQVTENIIEEREAKDETADAQTLLIGKPEQSPALSSKLLSEEREHGGSIQVDAIEEKELKEPSDEHKHETVNEVDKTEEEKVKEEEMQNEDSDGGKTVQEISSEKDETKEPQAVLESETIASQVIEESQKHGTLTEEEKESLENDKSPQSECVKELQSAIEDGATAAQTLSEEKQADQLHITTSILSSEVQEDETKETEFQENESPEKIPEQTSEIEEASNVKIETREKAFDNEFLAESEDAAIKDKLVKARDETRGGENQSEETNEGNEIILNEVSKEEVMEDKEVTETSYSTSHLEELIKDGSGEDELKDKLIKDKTNETLKTTQNKALVAEVQKQIVCEDKTVEDPGQASVAKIETTTVTEEEPSLELSQADSEGNEIVDDIQQAEETTNVASDEQILREIDPIENAEITSSICKEHAPIDLQDRVGDVEDIYPKEAEVDHSGEEITDNSSEEITKESTSVEDSIKVLSSDHVESSKKETLQVTEDIIEEREAKDETADAQTLLMGKPEQSPALSSKLLSEEREHGCSSQVDTVEEKELKEPSDEHKHETVNEVDKTEEEKVKEEEMQNEDSDGGKTVQEISSEKDETTEPQAVLESETIASQVIEESQKHGTLTEEQKIEEEESLENDKSPQSECVKELQSALEHGATAAQTLSEEKQADQLHITTSILSSEVQEDETKETELQENENPEKIPEQTSEIEEASNVKFETREKAFDNELFAESEDAAIKDKLVKARDETRGGENQFEETNEGNKIILNEVSKEEVMEDKEVTETSYSTSNSEELTKDGSGEDELKDKLIEDETNGAFETINVASNEQIPRQLEPIENAEITSSIGKEHVPIDFQDRVAESSHMVEVADVKEIYPKEAEVDHRGEEITDDSGEEITKESTSVEDLIKVLSSDHVESSTKETLQVTEDITEEREANDETAAAQKFLMEKPEKSLAASSKLLFEERELGGSIQVDAVEEKELKEVEDSSDAKIGEEICLEKEENKEVKAGLEQETIAVAPPTEIKEELVSHFEDGSKEDEHTGDKTNETLKVQTYEIQNEEFSIQDSANNNTGKDVVAEAETVMEDKEVTEASYSTSHSEELIKDGCGEDELKDKLIEDKKYEALETTFQTEEIIVEAQKTSENEIIEKQILSKDIIVEEPGQASVARIETATITKEESSTELSNAEGTKDLTEGHQIIEDIQQPDKTSDEQIPRELDPIENTEITGSIGKENVPIDLQDRVAESSLKVEVEDVKEISPKVVEHGGEKTTDNSGEEITKESTLVEDSTKVSSSDHIESSTNETLQKTQDMIKEREAKDETGAAQILLLEKPEEQSPAPSSKLPSKEGGHGVTTKADVVEEKEVTEVETPDKDSSDTKTGGEEICLEKEENKELRAVVEQETIAVQAPTTEIKEDPVSHFEDGSKEDELKDERTGDTTNETLKIATYEIQNEKLSMETLKDGANNNTEKDITAENESVKDLEQVQVDMKEATIVREEIPGEADPVESTRTTDSLGKEHFPTEQHERALETSEKPEVGDLEPGKAQDICSEAGVDHGEEKRTDNSGVEITQEPASADLGKLSLSDLLQRSTRDKMQVAERVIEKKELTVNKEEPPVEEAETIQAKEAKTDEEKDEEEEGDEHNKTDSGSDAPVMVEVPRDTDTKPHKKSHNILSNVGSKVKHSISKVRKAITGKSSHSKEPKPISPKESEK